MEQHHHRARGGNICGGAHVSTRSEDSTESGARCMMRKEQSTMSKDTDHPAFEPAEITVDGDTLKIERNKDTKKSAQELSTYIHALNLTAEQNNSFPQ